MRLRKLFNIRFKTSADYLVIFMIINLGVMATSIASGISTYNSNLSSKNQSLKQETIIAENIVIDALNEHSWQMRLIADKIMKDGGSLEKINQIITNHNKFDITSNFDQFLSQKDLYWVDKNGDIAIKNKVGILKYPGKLSNDYEVFNSKEKSWKLSISRDFPYSKDGYSLILTSFGVTDGDGKYMGSIASSIDINLIQNLLNKNLESSNSLVVLNSSNKRIVFQSNATNPVANSDFFKYRLINVNYDESPEGELEEEIPEHEIRFTNYKRVSNFPLLILSGYNYPIYKSRLFELLLKSIYPNIAVGLLLLITFLFYKSIRQRSIKRLSEVARKIGSEGSNDHKFPKGINSPEIYDLGKALLKIKYQRIKLQKSNANLTKTKNQLEEAIDIIKKSDIAQVEILKQVRKEISKNVDHAMYITGMIKHNTSSNAVNNVKLNLLLLKGLEQEINNITRFATDELNKEYCDMRNIIEKVAMSQAKELRIKGVKIDITYKDNLPSKVFLDQIRMTQIISSILHKTVRLLSSGDAVKIEVKIITKNKIKHLAIKIQDNGIGIGFKDYSQDNMGSGRDGDDAFFNGADISVDTIEELTKLHNGEIIYDNKIQKGSCVTIVMPYKKQEPLVVSKNAEKVDNIIYMPLKK
jgi:signal transduction histidine kinase